MTLKKKMLGAVAALTVVVGAGAVWAARPGGASVPAHAPFGLFGRLVVQHVIDELELSEAQTGQIKGILRSHRAEFRGIMDELHAAHDGVRETADQPAVDEAALRERVSRAVEPLADLAVLHARVHQEIGAVLTPEQRRKAEALREKWHSHREQMRGRLREWTDELLEDRS